MKWLGLGAGRRELKELEKTTIDKRIFNTETAGC